MLADVDALVKIEEINIERFQDSSENDVRQGHCVSFHQVRLRQSVNVLLSAWLVHGSLAIAGPSGACNHNP